METCKCVILEPELDAVAGYLGAADRLRLAAKLRRWACQLERSAQAPSPPAVILPAPPGPTQTESLGQN